MSLTRRHHFVPQFYLKGFSNIRGQVECFDRHSNNTRMTSVGNIAVETGLYDLHTDESDKSPEVEQWFSLLEGQVAPLFGEIDRGKWDRAMPIDSEKELMAGFIAAQMRRTPEHRIQFDALINLQFRAEWDWILERQGEEGARRRLENLAGTAITDQQLADAIVQARATIRDGALVDKNTHVLRIFKNLNEMAAWFHGFKWRLCITTRASFVTSDRPVVLWRRAITNANGDGVGIATAQHIYFPLSSQRLLIMSPHFSSDWSVEQGNSRAVRKYNARIANWSTRFVYFRPGAEPLQDIGIPKFGPGIWINGVKVHDNTDLLPLFRDSYLASDDLPNFDIVFGQGFK